MLGSDTNGAHHPSLQLAPKPHAPVSTRNPYAQSAKREAVLALVSQLEALNPTPQPLQHMDRLEGDWRLLYSTITITVRGGPRDTSALRLECPPHGSTHATQRRRRFLAPLAQPGWARLITAASATCAQARARRRAPAARSITASSTPFTSSRGWRG